MAYLRICSQKRVGSTSASSAIQYKRLAPTEFTGYIIMSFLRRLTNGPVKVKVVKEPYKRGLAMMKGKLFIGSFAHFASFFVTG